MDLDLRSLYKRNSISQYLEEVTAEIEKTTVLLSDVFHCIQRQSVDVEDTSLIIENLTASDCKARELECMNLLGSLLDHRKRIEQLKDLYEMTVLEVKNNNLPTLLDRLEKDTKSKIRDLLDNVECKQLEINKYMMKVQLRQEVMKYSMDE
ncbi:hypothetical protein CDAR_264691 [Caerostris darwini]|uniref:Uncharacterized protein n=1 Tax=Caerostris darwini TaxID=1538125 RepID=A0AAV4NP82_9ARAC|nr:hypothetical protein CDAR_264691 [Caerostris darwini]